MITKEIEIEELVRKYPFSVKYLMEQGIKCIACGEPIWGTLEEAAQEKGFGEERIEQFVTEMNRIGENEAGHPKAKQKRIETGNLNL